MIKYIGIALWTASGWLLGNSINNIYQNRVNVLTRFKEFILFAESEITFYKTQIDQLIFKFRQNNNKYDNIIFSGNNKSLLLTKETYLTISEFFIGIKNLDSNSLNGFIREILQKINFLLLKAEQDVEIKGKMYKKITPIIAIGITILTI